MALRRPFFPTLRLNRLSSINHAQHHDSPIRPKQAQPRQPLDPSAADPPPTTHPYHHEFADLAPPRERTELDSLLRAVQKQDASRICEAFVKWTALLADRDSPLHDATVQQARDLPSPTLSEILRSLDPVLNTNHDIAHNLNLTQGQTQFTDTARLVDDFGVRHKNRRLLSAMQTLMLARSSSQHKLAPADYEVLIRCAGAAVDYQAAKTFWASIATNGQQDSRTSKMWSEFIKARFMTEPLYYQFDRSRVAVQARDMYSNREPVPMAALKRTDNMRLSMNALKREPWNRRLDEPEEDVRRLLRRRVDYRGYKGHWIRALYYGHEMDEELLCASMVAFSRSSSLHAIKTMILQNYYGISVENDPENPGNTLVTGGVDLPAGSPIQPTQRLLNAIVESLGSMSHIPLAMKLVDFISRRYNIPIAHETWSNILNWTYLCASKPFKSMRKLHGNHPSTSITAANVRQVWDVMTSEPYGITPSFEDYDIYIKTLIIQRSFGRAIDMIRAHAMPHYEAAVEAHHRALCDDVLQNDVAPSPRATRRRQHAQLQKDHIHHHITTWFHKLLKTASANKAHRDGPVMQILIPNLLAEFDPFFHPQVRYRTAQGVVELDRPGVTPRFEWRRRWRETLPQKVAGIHVRDVEGADKPDFPWPQVQPLRVLEWQRRPRRRLARLGAPPKDEADREWWDELEEQMVL